MFENKASLSQTMKVVGVASSTWYKSKKEKIEDKRKYNKGRPKTVTSLTLNGETVQDTEVISSLKELRSQLEFKNGGGYRKLTHYLRRIHSYKLNKKKVYRLCAENNLLLPKKVKTKKRVAPIAVNRIIKAPLQLWELDIKYGYLYQEKKFFFLMAIIDVYLRYVVSYHLGRSCLAEDLTRTLKLSLKEHKMQEIQSLVVRMDNGPQMTSYSVSNFIKEQNNLYQELIPLKTPNKNAHIESFFSIIERE